MNFLNLHEVPVCEETLQFRLKVLVLADDAHIANVVKDHITSFPLNGCFEYVVVNPITEPVIRWLRFDAILIHYSIYILGEYYLPPEWAKKVSRFSGLKVQIIQDEYRNINIMKEKMDYLGIKVVFSSLQPMNSKVVYEGRLLKNVQVYSCFPGYVPDSFYTLPAPPIVDRLLHVVYRGRELLPFLGRQAQEKKMIGEQVLAAAKHLGLSVDISSEESTRIYGDEWYSFLARGRASLGVEGGASIFDFDGSIMERVLDYMQKNPDAEFEEVWCALLQKFEGNIVHRTVTPRILECIATKTALVLYEGNYSGILDPHRHYIPLKRDGSNMSEVGALLHNSDYLQKMTERAYSEVLVREDLSQKFYVRKIEQVLQNQFIWKSRKLNFMRSIKKRICYE
jgi:hypothetical protein